MKNTDPINLYDCISEFFKTDTLDQQNKYYCQECHILSLAQMRFRITQLPRVLIIHMNRFNYNGTKLKNPLSFDEEIQIDAEYLALKESKYDTKQLMEKEFNHVYNLYAIIVHEGYST